MSVRVSQDAAEVMGGNSTTPSHARVSQVVVETLATIASAGPPPPPPNPIIVGSPSGGGSGGTGGRGDGIFYVPDYNCYDCLLQFEQLMWDAVFALGIRNCYPVLNPLQRQQREQRKKRAREPRRF